MTSPYATAWSEIVNPIVQVARQHGPLPAIGSPEWRTAPQIVKIATLLVLGERWLIEDGQVDRWLSDDYPGGRYHRPNLIPAIGELNRRRYPPTGDRDLWIRYGPAGPPAEAAA